MYSVASGWLMTSLDPNAFTVSMVQVANSLPMFLFAIPAGALADIVNQRRFLIVGESTIAVVSAAFAALVWLHLITPASLLLFSFAVSVGSAMTSPAWQSVVVKLVPKPDLPSAVAANSVGINISRAIGPALGGVIVGAVSIAAPFWLDAFSNIGVIAALMWWRAPTRSATALPPETTLIFEQHWFAPLRFSCLAARTGRSCHWSLARRSLAARRCMVCFSVSLALQRWAARSSCAGSGKN
jgi:MFS family permease